MCCGGLVVWVLVVFVLMCVVVVLCPIPAAARFADLFLRACCPSSRCRGLRIVMAAVGTVTCVVVDGGGMTGGGGGLKNGGSAWWCR